MHCAHIVGISNVSRVLITGGAGFVGRHFTQYFLDRGDQVLVVDSIEHGTGGIDPRDGWPLFDPRDYRGFHFHREDCRSYFSKALTEEFDYALHLAAVVGGRLMIEEAPLAVAQDLSIDAAYWQWARQAAPRKTLCFSSSAAYPIRLQREQGYQLLREDLIDFRRDIGMPDMTYGWAKLSCEFLAQLAYEHHGLQTICYRPFSGYGEDQDLAYPSPSICRRVLAGKETSELTVWGSGRQMRDFIHIDDVVRGVAMTMDQINDASALNLSTGQLTSFRSFARTAAVLCGYDPLIRGMSNMPEGVFARGGDITKQGGLGFRAEISLENGIARLLAWQELKM